MKAKEILLTQLDDINATYGELIIDEDRWREAMSLALDSDNRIAFRASWGLEWAYFKDREGIVRNFDMFFEIYLKSTNSSAQRHYSKILYDIIHKGLVRLTPHQIEDTVTRAFDLLIDPLSKPAAIVWCMELIYYYRDTADWIEEALREITIQLINSDRSTPGVRNKGNKLLARF